VAPPAGLPSPLTSTSTLRLSTQKAVKAPAKKKAAPKKAEKAPKVAATKPKKTPVKKKVRAGQVYYGDEYEGL